MAFLTDKEAADRFGEARSQNIAKLQDILAGPPNVQEGEITLGKIYQERAAGEGDGAFEFDNFDNSSSLLSRTSTIPILGSIVQKGKFAV